MRAIRTLWIDEQDAATRDVVPAQLRLYRSTVRRGYYTWYLRHPENPLAEERAEVAPPCPSVREAMHAARYLWQAPSFRLRTRR